MIRILYMSDLHLEMQTYKSRFFDFFRPKTHLFLNNVKPPDLIVLAGDIHNGIRSIAYADLIAQKFKVTVVLVPGNHEYYFHDMSKIWPKMVRAANATSGRVICLDNNYFTFHCRGQSLHILGATFWTDFNLNQDVTLSSALAYGRMNDYRVISEENSPLTPAKIINKHFVSRAWLHKTLTYLSSASPHVPRLIVTHHAPSPAFLGNRKGAIAPAYASDLLPEFSPYAPCFWIHGHTHFRHATFKSGLWVLSAPHGYKKEQKNYDEPYQPGILEI